MPTINANAAKSAIQDSWDNSLVGDTNVNPVSLVADHCSITEVQIWATPTLLRPSRARESWGPTHSQRLRSSKINPRSIEGELLLCSHFLAATSMALRSVGVVAMTMIQGSDIWNSLRPHLKHANRLQQINNDGSNGEDDSGHNSFL